MALPDGTLNCSTTRRLRECYPPWSSQWCAHPVIGRRFPHARSDKAVTIVGSFTPLPILDWMDVIPTVKAPSPSLSFTQLPFSGAWNLKGRFLLVEVEDTGDDTTTGRTGEGLLLHVPAANRSARDNFRAARDANDRFVGRNTEGPKWFIGLMDGDAHWERTKMARRVPRKPDSLRQVTWKQASLAQPNDLRVPSYRNAMPTIHPSGNRKRPGLRIRGR